MAWPSIQVADCYVYSGEGTVKGICHFVGGAFLGAVPQLIYPVFLRGLAENGYTVIATPFPVSFKHKETARELRERFCLALEELRSSPIAVKVPQSVPVHGVGHSFGALAHSLIGCMECEDISTNVLISFNNKEVQEAIPIPGFLQSVTAAFSAYEQSPIKIVPDPLPIVKEVTKALLPDIPNPTAGISRKAVDDGLDQLDAVFTEIREGVVDFDPVPTESARMIESSYRIPETLLVQFTSDTIDESTVLQRLLEASPKQNISVKLLTGTHITPCIGDLRWLATIGDFDFDDNLAEFLQRNTVIDTRRLVRTIVDWLDFHSHQ